MDVEGELASRDLNSRDACPEYYSSVGGIKVKKGMLLQIQNRVSLGNIT